LITIPCPQCGAILSVPDEYAGRTGKCQNCEALIPIPGGAPVAKSAAVTVTAPTPAPTPAPLVLREERIPEDVRYPQLVRNARLVRIGSTIVAISGWISLAMGAISLLNGIVGLLHPQNDEVLGNNDFSRLSATAAAWGAVDLGISFVIAGILLVATAAFFKLVAYTCEVVRDMAIEQGRAG
jgi:hypothetical protein